MAQLQNLTRVQIILQPDIFPYYSGKHGSQQREVHIHELQNVTSRMREKYHQRSFQSLW